MSKIPEQTIEEIRSKTDIVDLIGEHVRLTKRGKNWFGLCPFHGESTPSFSVSEEKQLFHCFGCGASGNAITFVMDIDNRPFTEAVVQLAERLDIPIDASVEMGSRSEKDVANKQMYEAHEFAANFYNHLLLNTVEGEKAYQYLEQRGFTRENIEKYSIGWALDDWEALSSLLQRQGFDMKEMEQAGLVIQRDNGTGFFDRFRGRVMFPLYDDHGTIVGFSGRVLEKSEKEAKYLNSPETPIFEKGRLLYNFHRARLNARKKGNVIVFEGFMDTLAADRNGVENTVAVMGTALSDTQLIKLKRITNDLIVCCDGDNAGWEASKRFAGLIMQKGFSLKIAILPNKMDPDDYISENGIEAFREKILERPHTYMSFIMAYAKRSKNLSHENDVLQYIHEVMEELAGILTPVEKDMMLRQLSLDTDVSVDALEQHYAKAAGKAVRKPQTDSFSEPVMPVIHQRKKSISATGRAEQLLLSHMLNDGSIFDTIQNNHEELFVHEDYATIYIRLAGFYEQYGAPDFHRFAETIEDRGLRRIVLEAAVMERDPEHAEQEVEDCVLHLKKHRIQQIITQKMHESKDAEKMNDFPAALELAREIIQLRKSLSAM
ncbi:DNA primase [Sporosarcina gallistercoris]|uniref:DNA primase n=1 Tax=Sporosarcina gallistercoris TaxID=2762245 RepID=A0ABR8PF89_9BACL|nr:DNA primase [Sporosarcina gallistercoris]MBD7906848.1 DNA primase [Sporosarcina gallistercoris]